MTPAPFPADERRRLEALRRYDVLDSAPEPAFDDIARLAALICQTPAALITLIDRSRQWCKSRVGWAAAETPRDHSFCAHSIFQRDVMIVPDARADERFAGNPLVTGDPHIRFYAGAPLVTRDGHALGSLAVIDFVPRHLTAAQQDALQILSRQAMAQIELRTLVTASVGESEEQASLTNQLHHPQLRGIVANYRDVTERHLAEDALRRSESRKNAILLASPDCIVTMDHEGRILEFNPAAEKTFGFTQAQAIERTVAELIVPPALRERHRQGMARYLATGEARVLNRPLEMSALRADGTEFPVDITIVRVGETDPPVFTGFIRDITGRKQTERAVMDKLVELQRWYEATLGREERILELKREVNELLAQLQQPARYLNSSSPPSPPLS